MGHQPSSTSEPGQITEDWHLFNEFDVMAQILSDEPLDLLSGA